MNVLSLFSGCGGMDIGFEGGFTCLKRSINIKVHPDWITEESGNTVRVAETGFHTVFANDIRPDAKTAWVSYFSNRMKNAKEIYHIDSIVDLVKRAKDGEKVFPDNIDVVTGGFPCQDFSISGKRDLSEKKITFCHDPNRAANLLERERVTCRKKSKELRVKSPEEVLGYLPITAENLEKYNQLVENDPGYGTDGKIIHNVLSAYPLNSNREIVALKICLIDVTNSTHLGTHRSRISIDELAKIIMDIPNFDERLSCGDPRLINELAKSNGKINLFSFASKYCLYHNKEVYGRDDYSIFDSVVAETLPHYVHGLSAAKIDSWRSNFDYKAFADCIQMILDEYGIDIPNRRRKFDLFLWYANRKKQIL